MSEKKDLLDFLIEYLVASNYSNSVKIGNKSVDSKFRIKQNFNSKLIDIKLQKFSNISLFEKEYKKYCE